MGNFFKRHFKIITAMIAVLLFIQIPVTYAANLSDLKSKQQQVEQQKKELNSQINQKSSAIKSNESKQKQLLAQIDKLIDQISKTNQEIKQVENEIGQANQEIAALKEKIEALQKRLMNGMHCWKNAPVHCRQTVRFHFWMCCWAPTASLILLTVFQRSIR